MFITRERAAELYEGTPQDIFQGDIYRRLTLMHPKPGHFDTVDGPAIVVSHDCEWSKVAKWGTEYCLLVAPLREIESFERGNGEPGNIRANRVRFLFALPISDPIDIAYAADLTRIQPITVAELLENAGEWWASMGPELKPAFQGALTVFFTDRKPKGE